MNLLSKQSPDIAQGVDVGGAGDQGIMFGYANTETPEYMPLAITIAHDLVKLATQLRQEGKFRFAGPDMKSQVCRGRDNKSGYHVNVDSTYRRLQRNRVQKFYSRRNYEENCSKV